MRRIQEVIQLSTDYLTQRGISQSRLQAELVVGLALDLPRLELYLHFDKPLQEAELNRCRHYLERRGKGEPLAYIQGKVEFLGCSLEVGPGVLIPRQETEILAAQVVAELENENLEGKTLWDVCCGSGCLGVALKKRLPALHVVLSDASGVALAQAARNAELNDVEVELRNGDLLTPFEGEQADFIVCNPPYVATGEIPCLEREVRDHEPHLALDGGREGLDFYHRLARELPGVLLKGGRAWLELGEGQGKALEAIFAGPEWVRAVLGQDWSGRDRFFSLERV